MSEEGDDISKEYQNVIQSFANSVKVREHNPLHEFLKSLKPFLGFRVNYPLIRESLKYWDKEAHVFRIGGQEICPLVEEVEALLNLAKHDVLLLPNTNKVWDHRLEGTIGMSHERCRVMILGKSLLLDSLVESFLPTQAHFHLVKEMEYDDARLNACVLVVMGLYLLRGGYTTCPLRVISLVNALALKRRVAPLVLGETLLALDEAVDNPDMFLKGSPLMLHLWLYEKFSLLRVPRSPYDPYQVLIRGLSKEFVSINSRKAWGEVFEREIDWCQGFLDLGKVAVITPSYDGVVLPGLQEVTWYRPWRCLRQLGNKQVLMEIPGKKCHNRKALDSALSEVSGFWRGRRSVVSLKTLVHKEMSNEYKAWLIDWLLEREKYNDVRKLCEASDGEARKEKRVKTGASGSDLGSSSSGNMGKDSSSSRGF